jgi:hypothetical protein
MRKYIHVLLYVQVLSDMLNKQWIDISLLMKSHGQHHELVHPYWIPVSYLFLQTLIITKYIDVIERPQGEGQTIQWPQGKEEKDKQWSTFQYTEKDRVTLAPLKSRGELGCSQIVSCSCSTCDTQNIGTCKWTWERSYNNMWRNISSTIMFVPWKFYYVETVPLGTEILLLL